MGRTENGSGFYKNMTFLNDWGHLWLTSHSGDSRRRATALMYDRWDSLTGKYGWRKLTYDSLHDSARTTGVLVVV